MQIILAMAVRFKSFDEAKSFGASIRSTRKMKHETLEGLASRIGVHYSQISRVERGQAVTISTNVQKICKYLKLKIPEQRTSKASRSSVNAMCRRIKALTAISPAHAGIIESVLDAIEFLSAEH
jgi:transcriptional regulator with XRE-family HTH domain